MLSTGRVLIHARQQAQARETRVLRPARERLVSVAPRNRSLARQNHSCVGVGIALRDDRDRPGVTPDARMHRLPGRAKWGRRATATSQAAAGTTDDSRGGACSGAGLHGLRPRSHAASPCGSIRSGREQRPCAPSNTRSQARGLRAGRYGARYSRLSRPPTRWRATPCARPPAPSCEPRSPFRRCGRARPRSDPAWP